MFLQLGRTPMSAAVNNDHHDIVFELKKSDALSKIVSKIVYRESVVTVHFKSSEWDGSQQMMAGIEGHY